MAWASGPGLVVFEPEVEEPESEWGPEQEPFGPVAAAGEPGLGEPSRLEVLEAEAVVVEDAEDAEVVAFEMVLLELEEPAVAEAVEEVPEKAASPGVVEAE